MKIDFPCYFCLLVRDTSPLLSNKRVKINDHRTDQATTLSECIVVCEHQDANISQCKIIEPNMLSHVEVLSEQSSVTLNESTDENILTQVDESDIVRQTNENNANMPCIDIKIKDNAIIDTEQKQNTSVVLPSNESIIG